MTAIPREVSDRFTVRDADDAYALGLWCADSYWWSSSIGLSNVEPELILWFGSYLSRKLSADRLRVRVYEVEGKTADERVLELTDRISIRPASKMRRTAYHVYVNCRPLLRSFQSARENVGRLTAEWLGPYFAGRFDGDGAGRTKKFPGIRIAYTTEEEAMVDAELLERAGVLDSSVLYYASANEYCVYIKKFAADGFEELISSHSLKAACRFTL